VRESRLPHPERAIIAERKVVAYLLDETHPDGRSKARFFSSHGFSISAWRVLAQALRRHAAEHPVVETVESAFGMRYVVEGILHAPDGREPRVRTVWFVVTGGDVPTPVTAYPLKRRSQQ
jgi:hypothetical protein